MSGRRRQVVTRGVLPHAPVFEHVVTEPSDSFLWRRDDYPCDRNGWNIHPEFEIHLITNASGITLVGDYIGRFEPGHLSIVGSSLPHDWVTDLAPGEVVRGRDVVLQFDASRLNRAAAALPELAEVGLFLARAQHGLVFHGAARQQAAGLLMEIGPARGVERLSLFMRLMQVLSRTGECGPLSSAGFMPALDSRSLDLIQRVLAFVFERFSGSIQLADAARVAGMSESSFSRFFQRASGNSFTGHLTKLRVSRACDLLANTTMPVTDICYEVGYANISNFNRNFLRQRGSTPSQYRLLARRASGVVR